MSGTDNIEVAVMAATTSGLLFIAYQLVSWMVSSWLMAKRRRAYDEYQRSLRGMPESMRAGSDLVTDPAQNYGWLFGVYSVDMRTNVKTFLSSGVIINSHFVTCHHAIAEAKKGTIHVRTHDGVFHGVNDWVEVEADVVAARVAPGYASAKIKPLNAPTHAKVISAKNAQNSSFGVLKHERDMCAGRLSYSGSTLPGFSGSPYTNGQQVLGMHLGGGGAGNFGVAASLISASISRILERRESSELLALGRALRTAKRSDIYMDQGMDEVRIEVGGRFFFIDRDEFDELLEDEGYADLLLEEELTEQPRRLRSNWKSRKDYREEPDYEPEGTSEDDPFLGQTPPQVLPTGDWNQVTVCQQVHTEKIQNMQILMEEIIAGQKEQQAKLQGVFTCMQEREEGLRKDCLNQILERLITLERRLTESTPSPLMSPPCQETNGLTSTSAPSSVPSTQQVVRDSESSAGGPPSAMRWDGMDSDLRKYTDWRSSKDPSSVDFVTSREDFLSTLGLNVVQRKALVKRFINIHKRWNYKAQQKNKGQATTSSSS